MNKKSIFDIFLFFPMALIGSLIINLLISEVGIVAISGQLESPLTLFALVLFSIAMMDKRNRLSPINVYIVLYIFYYLFGVYILAFLYPGALSGSAICLIVFSYFFSVLGVRLSLRRQQSLTLEGGVYSRGNVIKWMHVAFIFSVMAAISWYLRIGVIPIFAQDVEHARIDLASGTFLHRQLITTFIPFYFCALIAYMSMRMEGVGSKRLQYWLIFYFLLGSFLLISQGYRTFMLSFWFIGLLIANKVYVNFLSKKSLIAISVFVIGFVFIFGLYRFYSANLNSDRSDSVAELLFANFFVRPIAVEEVADAFPANFPFQYFSTYIRGLNFLIPGEDKGLGVWLKEDVLGKEFAGAGYNPGVVGEFYLSFGPSAIFVMMFLYGWVIGAFAKFSLFKDNVLNIILSSSVSFYFMLALSPGISVSILPIFWSVAAVCSVSFFLRARVKIT